MANANLPSFFADVNTSIKILSSLGWDMKTQDSNDKINCVARMKYNKTIYWAVNGAPKDVNNPNTNAERIDILNSFLKDSFKNHIVVHLSTTTPKIDLRDTPIDPKIYFPTKNGTVSLTDYKNKCKQSSPPQTEINVRLFSCCERKLIAAVRNPLKDSFKIDVIKPPCELCLAAKVYLNNQNFQLNYANWWLVEAYNELHPLGLV